MSLGDRVGVVLVGQTTTDWLRGGDSTAHADDIAKGVALSLEELELERLPNADVIVTNCRSASEGEPSGERDSRDGARGGRGGVESTAPAESRSAVAMTRRRCSCMKAEALLGLEDRKLVALEGRAGERPPLPSAASRNGEGIGQKPSKGRCLLSPSCTVPAVQSIHAEL
jgi:hypothetical protein